ncbi:unnamed protein product [Cyclocybe aegerita]|uniref:Uncharacterized protein n=1 Tax=Cyclocybe aegerita TaxID=1973307 RepID=A0A8S0XU65_CYCAE|nr:unnamed protein product [Cyclocybe aegerita]
MCDNSLFAQLCRAEERLLSSMTQSPDALEEFSRSWAKLQTSINEAVEQDTLDEDTATLAQTVSARIEVIASLFLDLHTETTAFSSSLQDDLTAIFSNLTLSEASGKDTEQSESVASSSLPPYIEPAYTWLLHNLHNPYPSKQEKAYFSLQSGCSLKDIEHWFTSVRRRIGWNNLRVQRFRNKRCLIVQAATRFFDSSADPLDAGQHIAFATVLRNVENLYQRTLHKTSLTPTSNDQDRTYPDRGRRHTLARPLRRRQQHTTGAFAYPSPSNSASNSPERFFSSPEPSASPYSPPISCTHNRKRRQSSITDSDYDSNDEKLRPSKRSRSSILSDGGAFTLPTPVASPTASLDSSLSDVGEPETLRPPILSTKRKRRLSEGDESEHVSKRPHSALNNGSRVNHTPTQDHQKATPFDSWLHGTEERIVLTDDIPKPVTAETPYDADELDVAFHQYDYSPYATELSLEAGSTGTRDSSRTPESIPHVDLAPISFVQEAQGIDFAAFLDFNHVSLSQDSSFFADASAGFHSPFNHMDVLPAISMELPSESYPLQLEWASLLDSHSSLLSPGTSKPSILGDYNSRTLSSLITMHPGEKWAKHEHVSSRRDELWQLGAGISV